MKKMINEQIYNTAKLMNNYFCKTAFDGSLR